VRPQGKDLEELRVASERIAELDEAAKQLEEHTSKLEAQVGPGRGLQVDRPSYVRHAQPSLPAVGLSIY
jgi:hypothetical protein